METKQCQFCLQEIAEVAMVCNHCTRSQVDSKLKTKYLIHIANQRLLGGVDVFRFLIQRVLAFALVITFVAIYCFWFDVFERKNSFAWSELLPSFIVLLVWWMIQSRMMSKMEKENSLTDIFTEYHLLQSVIPNRDAKIHHKHVGKSQGWVNNKMIKTYSLNYEH